MVPALLNDGHAPTHGLADSYRDVLRDGRKAADQGPIFQPLEQLCLRGLATGCHGRVVELQGLVGVDRALADPEMVDGDEDPPAYGMPLRLGALSRTRQLLGEVATTRRRARSTPRTTPDRKMT
jgi:hypothetical protein